MPILQLLQETFSDPSMYVYMGVDPIYNSIIEIENKKNSVIYEVKYA